MKKLTFISGLFLSSFLLNSSNVTTDLGRTCCLETTLDITCHWIVFIGPTGTVEHMPIKGIEVNCPEI